MRAKDALERSLTKLLGSVLALCCAEPLLPCTRCLCSSLRCTGAELISLVMVWLPPWHVFLQLFQLPCLQFMALAFNRMQLIGGE